MTISTTDDPARAGREGRTAGDRSRAALRRRLRACLPRCTFEPQPLRALWFAPLATFIAGASWVVVESDLPWPAKTAIAVALGNAYASMLFLAHEALHGALGGSVALQNVLGALGLWPFLISPGLWRIWHNQLHHGRANHPELDPDVFGTVERYERCRTTRFVTALAPGARNAAGYVSLLYWFTLHGQIVLWGHARSMPGFERLPRGRARVETIACAVVWLVVVAHVGFPGALFVCVIPLAVANQIAMSYIATNHLLMPQYERDEPLVTTMGVRTHPLLDRLHFRFSHHLEHHLFPRVSGKFAPAMRNVLLETCGTAYAAPSHWAALAAVYRTPRLSQGGTVLRDPGSHGRAVDLPAIRS